MDSKEAFEKWFDIFDGDIFRKDQCHAAWNAALEWAAKGQEPDVNNKENARKAFISDMQTFNDLSMKENGEYADWDIQRTWLLWKRVWNLVPICLHPAPIPEGWKLVPIEPTGEMWDAVWSAFGATGFEDMHKRLSISDIQRLYAMFHKQMLAAALEYKPTEGDEE